MMKVMKVMKVRMKVMRVGVVGTSEDETAQRGPGKAR